MGILSRSEILKHLAWGQIVITPLDHSQVGPNSVDLHLESELQCHYGVIVMGKLQDKWQPARMVPKCSATGAGSNPDGMDRGYILQPQRLYLATTREYTATHGLVPYLDGRSSIARYGISIHQTAGRGDVGFCGKWTCEITVAQTVWVPLTAFEKPWVQITYHELAGDKHEIAARRNQYRGRYQGQDQVTPSRFEEPARVEEKEDPE